MRRYGLVDIPDLASDIDAVPITRTITINGTTYDLSADRTWSSVGTNIYNTNGTLTSARTLTSGGFNLTFTGSNTASSAIARGILMNHTLVAAANSDVLSALDIQPTFTNGAFTGVSNLGLRIIFSGTGTGVGNYLSIINNTYPVINSGGVIAIYAQNSEVFYASTVQTIIKGRTTTSQLNFNLGATEFGRFFPTTGNLALQNGGTYTDNNHRLQVTGTSYFSDSVGIGTSVIAGRRVSNRLSLTGATTAIAYEYEGNILSDVTSDARGFSSYIATSGTFTLPILRHFFAAAPSTFSATITNQYGFWADAGLIGATNNFGFYGNIASGSNRWNLYMNGTANNYMAGSLGIGSTSLATQNLRLNKQITGATAYYNFRNDSQIQADVTSFAVYNYTFSSTAASTTINFVTLYEAGQGTFGAGSTITNQVGFYVQSSLIGATNNFGFRASIASGTNRWNIYMDGTAINYLNGALLIGTTTDAGFKLDVSGTIRGTSSITGAQFLASNTNGLSLSDNAVGGFLSYGYNSGRTNAAGHNFYNGISTELMRITSGGNVGIGTTSPISFGSGITSLTIKGTSGAIPARAGAIIFESQSGSDGSASIYVNAGVIAMYSGATNFASAIERMRITSGGNLLVGTTTDSGEKLVVNGIAKVSGNVVLGTTALTGGGSAQWITTNGTSYGGGLISSVNGVAKAYYYYDNNANAALVQGIAGVGVQLWANNAVALSIATTGAATFSSSVTASSLIKSGGTSAQILAADGSVITAGTNITISGGTISSSGVSMAIGGSITSATEGSVLFAGTSGVLQQDNANFFWDDTNNRLGIGTTTPSNKLSIVETTNVASGFNVTNTTAGTSNSLNMNLFADTTAGYLQFQKRSSTHTATGIAAASSGLLYNSEGDLIIGTGGATSWIRFATNGIATADMNLTANGRLLLGTSTESTYILDVNGTFRSQGNAYASTKAWVGTNETTSPGALTVYSTSAANQIRIVGTTPATVYTDIFGSGTPTIVGAVGGVSTTNNFVTGTVVGDFVVTNQLTTKRLYCVSNTGGVYLATNATSWTANSDITLKNINSYITNAVDKLMNLSVINYHLKDDITKKEQIGLIAQEVKQVFPEIIEESEIGILGLRYTEIIPILVKAIQELKNEIDKLKINN